MRLICETENRRIWTADHFSDTLQPFLLFEQAFPCLIYSTQKTELAFKIAVASKIISAGCQFVVCAGAECEQWHDVVDDSILAAEMMSEHDPHKTIMTTWHAEDSFEELVFFFIHSTFLSEEDDQQSFYEMASVNYLVLFVGHSPDITRLETVLCSNLKGEQP